MTNDLRRISCSPCSSFSAGTEDAEEKYETSPIDVEVKTSRTAFPELFPTIEVTKKVKRVVYLISQIISVLHIISVVNFMLILSILFTVYRQRFSHHERCSTSPASYVSSALFRSSGLFNIVNAVFIVSFDRKTVRRESCEKGSRFWRSSKAASNFSGVATSD